MANRVHNLTQTEAKKMKADHGVQFFRSSVEKMECIKAQEARPSGKFTAHLFEIQKKNEMDQMQQRVNKLNRDNERAERSLSKTIMTNKFADDVRQRKADEIAFKEAWLAQKHRDLMEQRENNRIMRETMRANIQNARKEWIASNFLTRKQLELDMQPHINMQRQMNEENEKRLFSETENLYVDRKRAAFNQVNNFNNFLHEVTEGSNDRT